MKTISKILAFILTMSMLITAIPAHAAGEDWTTLFGSDTETFGTDIEYIEDLGLYVTGGKGFYTSPDAINWTMRGGAVYKEHINGFAYGGPEGEEYFMLILNSYDGTSVDGQFTRHHKSFIMDKYLSTRYVTYNYDNEGNPLLLKGVIEWDDFTGKFWCGAALTDGQKPGLYYSDGERVFDEESGQTKIIWTMVDSGAVELYDPENSTVFVNGTNKSTVYSILSDITSDGNGRIVAYGLWANKKGETFGGKSKTTNDIMSAQCGLLVNAKQAPEAGSTYQAKVIDFGYLNHSTYILPYVGIDAKGNVISQSVTSTKSVAFAYASFDSLWEKYSSGDSIVKADVKNLTNTSYSNQASQVWAPNNNNTGVIGKVISTSDKLFLIPRAGHGITSTNLVSDIYVATYNEDGTLNSKYTTFINNQTEADKVLGAYNGNIANIRYVTDVICADDDNLVILRGKSNKQNPNSQAYAPQISVISTKDTVTDSSIEEVTDRSAKVSYAKVTEADIAYSHIEAATTVINVKPGEEFSLPAEIYDVQDAQLDAEIGFEAVGDELAGIDYSGAEDGLLYVWEDCEPGSYQLAMKAYAKDNETVAKEVTYTVNVNGDFVISNNNNTNFDAQAGVEISGITAGKNMLTATCNKETDENTMAVIAVYKGNVLASCSMEMGNSVSLSFTVAEEANPDDYTYMVMFWDVTTLKPL